MKLKKSQLTARDKLLDKLRDAKVDLEGVVETANDELVALRDRVTDELGSYNAVLLEVAAWRNSVVEDLRADLEERSEKWQESDAGQEASSWIDELENVDLDEVDVELPDDLDTPDLPHVDDLEAVATEAANA